MRSGLRMVFEVRVYAAGQKGDNRVLVDTLIASIFLGIIGSGYFMYGKKAHRPVPLVSGVLLCVFPYFIDGFLWTMVIGAALLAMLAVVLVVKKRATIGNWWHE